MVPRRPTDPGDGLRVVQKNACEVDERFSHSAGTKIPNPWGLYDMHGNAEEWVQDWYGAFYYETARELDPQGPDRGVARVLRGGSYSDLAENVRSAYRKSARPVFFSGRFGMRVLARAALPTGIEQKSWGTLKKEARCVKNCRRAYGYEPTQPSLYTHPKTSRSKQRAPG